MKPTLIKVLLAALVIGGLTSCEKEDQTANILERGSWNVTLYSDHGTDETAHFSGYTFSFDHDGTVTATKQGSVVTGTWSAASSSKDDKLLLDLGTTGVFEDLTDDWYITKKTSKEVRLKDSNDDNDVDVLTFERL